MERLFGIKILFQKDLEKKRSKKVIDYSLSDLMLNDPMYGIYFLTQHYKAIWKILDPNISKRFETGKDIISKECFLPAGIYRGLITHYINEGIWDLLVHSTIESAAFTMAAICPFKYTRHIYEFTDELSSELLKTEFNEKIPFEVFDKFPNYSICIKYHEFIIYCAIVDLASKDDRVLIFSYFSEDENTYQGCIVHRINCVALPIKKGKTIDQIFSELGEDNNNKRQNHLSKKYINFVLYICSQNPDIIERNKNVKIKVFNEPQKHWHHGFKLLPAKKDKVFILGQTLTAQLQSVNQHHTGTKLRPHIRRAHWHGYWTGKNRTDFILKWLPPTLIATNNGYEESNCA